MDLNFNKSDGLIPAIVQDAETKDVLMLAYMNRESWEATLKSGKATFWSRSRQKLWLKGESSGHVQIIKNIFIDCDDDTILLQVEQLGGAACHTGHRSCFYRKLEGGELIVVGEKVFDPKDVYK
ncbi:MAG: phosphoribosyl-AMP cyclohydrolase [Deltaproteobacteria bacterium ADurb.Bin151]|jgi:phosphoribosyl-AMP cyclohydrolase|nr:phosphoribosyl-AMP cyclohydrolase [Smithella sp.]OQB57070.1 MAG: phosphoribosyl-AMP cyclohydrolase [Deltaproteobacteria bacterium ADurb.Bin151]HNZ10872.1 phosphoribosyl-AMP cyclohydrolase [Smithellaceae bacterium]HOG81733.1 phosphoribosyl-AMP cyclohydrolase [Smithellaceae bacterium]HOQ41950.1 phosphoribosyl-AMP cyclohydrolase [Smithellaceae bacterium]